MKNKPRDKRINRSLFSFKNYIVFFILISFAVTACFLLFLDKIEVNTKDIRYSAIITFGNVLFLSLLFTLVDGIRRKITIQRPVKRILDATHKLTKGDFDTRIKPLHPFDGMNEFDAIIEDFNIMAKELAGTETLRTDFIASVSHELKTPLAVIQNYSAMLQAPGLTEEERVEYAKSIAAACRNFSELITNILKLSKLENQGIFPEGTTFDLSEQLRRCLLDFEDSWEKKGLRIETDIEDTSIWGDAELLTLVWNNLISNAIKFTNPGGKISVALHTQGAHAVVTVADTGCGIDAKTGPHIFEKFYQGDASRAVQGNGLGLALVKRVVDITGGEINVESTAGLGSTFTVTLQRENG